MRAATCPRAAGTAGMLVCHNCPDGDNPPCCNDAHLFLGSPLENSRDMVSKGRHLSGNVRKGPKIRGERQHLAKLTDSTVRELLTRRAAGETLQGLAGAFGITKHTVWEVVHRKTWKHAD